MAEEPPQSASGVLKAPQDFFCGLMYILVGAIGVYVGWDYPRGTPIRLGTGVFPALLSWGLIIIGGIIAIKGLIIPGPPVGGIAWRPVVLIAVAATAFAILIEPGGLLLATLVMMVIAAFAGDDHTVKEFSIFAVIMLFMAWFLFIYILDMPIKVFPWS